MKTALALSGGGARGSFEVGAVKCLYRRFGVRPELLTGCSVGSINAVKLAEARIGQPAEHLQAIQGLEQIWYRLQTNDDMYLPAPWLAQLLQIPVLGAHLKAAINGESGPEMDVGRSWIDLALVVPTAVPLASLLGPSIGRQAIEALAAGLDAPSVFVLDPMDMKLRDPVNLDLLKVAKGTPLMMAVTSLESGALRYVTGDGRFVERDGRTPVASAVPAEMSRCTSQAEAFRALQGEISRVRTERAAATTAARRQQLDRALRSLHVRTQHAFDALQACLVSPGPTVDATVSVLDGVMASSTMPAVFVPVRLGLETYVDGGVREIVPIGIAAQLGATEIYAVLASSRDLPNNRSFARESFLSILMQALVEITLKEVVRDDLEPANAQGVPIHVIAPTFDVHGTTQVEPGLISISMDYGYLRAADVVTATAGFDRTRAFTLSDAITMQRRDSWELESAFASPPDPGLRHTFLEELRLRKWVLKSLVGARQGLSAPTPPDAFQWHAHWERHSADDPAVVIPNPWARYASLSHTTAADSPATYLPDFWVLREIGGTALHQLLKGATFELGGPDDLRAIGYSSATQVELPDDTVAALPKAPAGETLLREPDSPTVWYCDGSHRFGSLTPAIIAALGLASSPVRLVPHGRLDQIPVGGQLFWVGDLVVTDNALTVLRAWEPTPQREGTTSSTKCYLYNRGPEPITVTNVEVTGDATGAFTVNTPMPVVVYPGVRETVNLTFHPTQAGPISAHLLIESDDQKVPAMWVPVRTSATPIGPHGRFTVNPTTLSFPNTVLGSVDGGQLTLENVGDADAAVSEIALTDEAPPAQFLVPPVMPPAVEPGRQQSVMLGFAPTLGVDAHATAVLTVGGGANYTETHRITLAGHCVTPVLVLRPPDLDFGNVPPGQQRSLSLEVANEGDAPLTLSGIFASMGAGSFLFQPTPSLPMTIPAGSVETMHVTYSAGPVPGRADQAAYDFVSDDPRQPRVTLEMSGAATGSRIEMLPDFIDFHGVQATPVTATVTLYNLGSTDVSVHALTLENGRHFGLIGVPPLPITVQPRAPQSFQVEFTAQRVGQYFDKVIVSSDDHQRPEIANAIEARLLP